MKLINDFPGQRQRFVEIEAHVIPCAPAGMTSPRRPPCLFARMQRLKTIVPVCFALLLAACGGGGHLSVGLPGEGGAIGLDFRPGRVEQHRLPRISGGIPPYESSIDGCPDWVTLLPEEGVLSGTGPASASGQTFFCTYRVTESDPGFRPARSVSYGLRLTVGASVPDLSLPRPPNIRLSVGVFRRVLLPEIQDAEDGVPPYTYSFTCAGGSLPSGMGFVPATRIFAGVPEASFHDSCAYTVTDGAQRSVSAPVEVEVTSTELTFRDDVPGAVNLDIGTFYDSSESAPLPEASGGVEPYTYSFTCAGGSLPSGMGFVPATRIFAGTPDASFHDSCTYTVTDSAQPAATLSQAVVVSTQALALPSVPDRRFVIGDFRSYTLPEAEGGTGPYTYTFTCTAGRLPPGVGFAPATRELAGATDAVFRDSCTYTATDSAQPAATVSRDIVVTSVAHGSLALPDNTPEKVRFVIGDFRSLTLPAARGGVRPYTYAFNCTGGLPSGVGFASRTRRLAGVADQQVFDKPCTYMVTDSAQSPATVSRTIQVTVESLALPDTPEEIRFVIGNRRSLTLPAARGGVAPYMYAFRCDGGSLPSGMSFAPTTRVFSGTPNAPFPHDSCTYMVTDSAQSPATVSRTIQVTVESFALPATPEEIRFVIGDFGSFTLPAATGGVRPYTYAFTCTGGLPSGVGFASRTRRLAGVANEVFDGSCRYTVTDSAQSPATVSRTIQVTVGSLALPATPEEIRFVIGDFGSFTLPAATGGVAPYTYSYSFTCVRGRLPSGVSFSPATRVLAGVSDAVFRDSCKYTVTDRAQPAETVSRNIAVVVEPLDRGRWRFRTRTVARSDHSVDSRAEESKVVVLPHALPETGSAEDCVTYALPGISEPASPSSSPLRFHPVSRQLSYIHPDTNPTFDAPTTFRYEVRTYPKPRSPAMCGDGGEALYKVQDALCVDVSYRDPPPREESPNDGQLSTVRVWIRDDASWDETRRAYRCPDAPRSTSSSGASVSNPVHTALGPVHARRAVDVARTVVRDRVRGWTPGTPHDIAAPTVSVDFASLSGLSDGFDYSGSSESVSGSVDLGASAWQAGLVGSFTRTDLRYHAESGLSGLGYHAGEHDTEILSLHPFAAWHAPSGGHLWASLGAGTGDLRHRDDLGFRSWSRSDVRLWSWAAGFSVPVARALYGALDAEAGIESFSFDIEGGGRISSSLPTLRGRDWRAGLAWSAPVPGAPSVAVGYRRLTGDGPEGGRLEARGSVSVEGVFDSRLALLASAEGSFGLGDLAHESWGLSGGVRFAPGATRRGFGLELDTHLQSSEEGDSAGVGIRAEAGYGLWGGPLFGTLRPHVGLTRHPDGGFLRRSVGVDLRDTPHSRAKVEIHDHPHGRAPALRFTLRQRF